jgi:hypothetical protein
LLLFLAGFFYFNNSQTAKFSNIKYCQDISEFVSKEVRLIFFFESNNLQYNQ